MSGSIAALLLVEFGVRVATHSLFVWVTPEDRRYSITDPVVGHLPRPGVSLRHPRGFAMNIGEWGTRQNGNAPPPAERPLMLAVGDSFAFGDQVDDQDSWPAALERLSGERVINAGVPGFGLDQTVLRAEQLVDVYAPDTIIAAFIPHDVTRCEMSYWSGNAKPYFDIEGSGLHWNPAPLPSSSLWDPLKRLASRSVALDFLLATRLHWEGPDTFVHHQGTEVACLLMGRLADLALRRSTCVVVLAQPQAPTSSAEQIEIKNSVLACAAANHLPSLDLFPVIDRLPAEERARLYDGHMTVAGNQLVATELARFLEHDARRAQ